MVERRGTRQCAGGILLALVLLSSCSPTRTWEVRGRVVGFGDDGRTVFISHENVPGLMPAMTMPFAAGDSVGIRGIQNGDAVRFVLHIVRDSTWITDIRPLHPGESPLVLEESVERPDSTPAVAPLLPGEQVPDVRLLDARGEGFQLSRYRGRYVLVNFIYTRCPLPDFCPWLTRRFAALYDPLKAAYGDDISFLSVTLDPEFDRPEVLQHYRERHAQSMADWTFATGAPGEIRRLAAALGVSYAAVSGEVVHALVTALVDTTGALNTAWRGNEWPIDEVPARLTYLTSR